MTHVVAVWDQDSFAWYTDAGGEGTNQIGTTNSNPTSLITVTNYRLRYLIQETAGSTVAETPIFGLEFRVDPAGGTAFGAWTAINSANPNFNLVSTANVTDGGATTQQIGAGTFRAGQFSYVDATDTAPTAELTATAGTDEYEVEWVLEFANAANAANFEFRVIWDNASTPPATPLDSYTNTTQVSPTATTNDLLADDVEAAANVTTPVMAHIHVLTANDVEAAANVTTPVMVQVVALTANDVEAAANVTIPTATEIIFQFERPDADTNIGSWTNQAGSAVNLFQSIDEVTPSDADYVRSEINPVSSAARFRLSDFGSAVDTNYDHIIRYRYGKDFNDGQQIDITVRLIQGASTVIATWSHPNVSTTIAQANQTLTAPQVASITNYADLFIEFEANAP